MDLNVKLKRQLSNRREYPAKKRYVEDISDQSSNDNEGQRMLVSGHAEDEDYFPDLSDHSSTFSEGKPRRKKKRRNGNATLKKEFDTYSSDYDSSNDIDCKTPRERRRKMLSIDDGDERAFKRRLKQLRTVELDIVNDALQERDSETELEGGFKVPGAMWNKLYRYQKSGVRWLWELHCQKTGGILGDEMGLGKTIQIICFLAGLRYSKLPDKVSGQKNYAGLGPTLIVCPATVMHQWVKEVMSWWSIIRIAILHSSGSYSTSEEYLIKSIVKDRGILVTGFSTLLIHQTLLLRQDWHYVILDEGHKIRNPDAKITIVCKQFRTCHRIILSGSPMQNNLKELWSLFDFVFPGKLGTLPDFLEQFSVPIVQGGYSNASDTQVLTAYKCACVLRDTISPYLLQRSKSEVQIHINLPTKSEQVLFCRLTDEQRQVYKAYLDSPECQMILSGNFMVFPGLTTLRKLCNHPDLVTGKTQISDPSTETNFEDKFGFWRRSGKMIVVQALLKLWKSQNHKVLLFTQSKKMLDILDTFVKDVGYSYLRMDGTTVIAGRQALVQRFNNDASIFLFLLTTRVGGLGINLTGADRVIIFDPDWNPSTDTQARERAWRIGQKREVTVYRLLSAGTIEEKIFHRQIFKQFLTNRVLKDPKQRRFFKSNDLHELFSLGDDNPATSTETSAIFAGTSSDVCLKSRRTNNDDLNEKSHKQLNALKLNSKEIVDSVCLSKDKVAWMKNLAKTISQNLGKLPTQISPCATQEAICNSDDSNKSLQSYVINIMETTDVAKNFQVFPSDFLSMDTVNGELNQTNSNYTQSKSNVGVGELHQTNSNDTLSKSTIEKLNQTNSNDTLSKGAVGELNQTNSNDTLSKSTVEELNQSNYNDTLSKSTVGGLNQTNSNDTLSKGAVEELNQTNSNDTLSKRTVGELNQSNYNDTLSKSTVGELNQSNSNDTLSKGAVRELNQTNSNDTLSKSTVGEFNSNDTLSKNTVGELNQTKSNDTCASKRTVKELNEINSNNIVDVLSEKLVLVKSVRKSSAKKWQKKQKEFDKSAGESNIIDLVGKLGATCQTNNSESSKSKKNRDEYLLQKILLKSGVHSALHHDKILMSASPDYVIAEAEADQVARRAAHALKQSRLRCQRTAAPGVPTWTGQHGVCGAPQRSRLRFGQKKSSALTTAVSTDESQFKNTSKAADQIFDGSTLLSSNNTSVHSISSSNNLLQNMRTTSGFATRDALDVATLNPADTAFSDCAFISELRNFVAFGTNIEGQATTKEILDQFRNKIPQTQTINFKAVLKQVCHFDRSTGTGVWYLRPEFR